MVANNDEEVFLDKCEVINLEIGVVTDGCVGDLPIVANIPESNTLYGHVKDLSASEEIEFVRNQR